MKCYDSYFEMQIKSRSCIRVWVGKLCSGYFVCMPDLKVGCYISKPNDYIGNGELLSKVTENIVDGVTVAYALKYFFDADY